MEKQDSFTFLRKVPLFADLPESYLKEICDQAEEIHLPAGTVLFTEGSAGEHAYIIVDGEIEIFKESNRKTVLLAVRRAGEVIGEMAILEAAPRSASGRALTDTHLLAIGFESFNQILDTHPSAVRIMLHTVTHRLQSTELLLRQSEKMAQIGILTAGIAHELNNPAAAVKRGAERMKTMLAGLQQSALDLHTLQLSAAQMDFLRAQEAELQRRAQAAIEINPLERSDREEEIEAWLDEAGIENGWDYSSILVEMDYSPSFLETLHEMFQQDAMDLYLRWASTNFSILRLLDEVSQGAERISEIVSAMKTYVYLDQGPTQEVNIHQGLEDTLVILRFKLKQGVTIRREFDPNLPMIEGFGSELNQVWTNIIDNAIDAMDGKGEINLRTHTQDAWVVVEIRDTGPGIPADVLPNIFSPFFTTKAVGKGTGLGLNTSYNIVRKHNGDLRVFSQPGETRFEIWLPLNRKAPKENIKSGTDPQKG